MASIPQSNPKESSYDGKGAVSGNPEPSPEKSDVEMVSQHGIELNKDQPLKTKATVEKRDQERWELNPDSKGQ